MARQARAGTIAMLMAAVAGVGVLLALGPSAGSAGAIFQPSPGDFVRRVDNPWFPLIPGTTFVYRGVKDGKIAKDVFSVTSGTKTIQGIRCTGVRDRLFLAGRLEERTTDWYAQDVHGTGWYL